MGWGLTGPPLQRILPSLPSQASSVSATTSHSASARPCCGWEGATCPQSVSSAARPATHVACSIGIVVMSAPPGSECLRAREPLVGESWRRKTYFSQSALRSTSAQKPTNIFCLVWCSILWLSCAPGSERSLEPTALGRTGRGTGNLAPGKQLLEATSEISLVLQLVIVTQCWQASTKLLRSDFLKKNKTNYFYILFK